MKKILALAFLFLFFTKKSTSQTSANALIPIERVSMMSEILKEERTFQIYLPPNYFFSEKGNFPVVYLMDGDYNFHFGTGLIEFLSNVGGKIPEMIVVGISDKGSTKYRNYCSPTTNTESGGNADNFMSYIEKELKPYIKKNYRASEYDILIGHSMGGLFVTNHWFVQPESFDSYIAIDPSLWWGDYALSSSADSIFQKQKELNSSLFISLANTQGMGVRQFVGVLDKYFPGNPKWTFKHYENENHGSVAMVTIKDALEKIFKDWEISREKFYSFKSAQGIIDHYKKLSEDFSTSFSIPAYSFGNMMYYYYRKDLKEDLTLLETQIAKYFPQSLEEYYVQLARNHMENGKLDEAEKVYTDCIKKHPLSFRSFEGLSKILFEQKKFQEAKYASDRSIEIAKQVKVRQWQLNELISNNENIKNNSSDKKQ